jgi:hypothetical protein
MAVPTLADPRRNLRTVAGFTGASSLAPAAAVQAHWG